MEEAEKILRKNPYNGCNFISKVLFIWIFPLFNEGWSKELSYKDLYTCPRVDDPQYWADKLEKEWLHELKLYETGQIKKPTIHRAVIRTFISSYLSTSIFYILVDGVIRFIQPFLIYTVVTYLTTGDESMKTQAHICIAFISITSILLTILFHHGFVQHNRHGNKARTAITHLMYKKLLRLHKSAFEETDIGQIVNILANDLNRCEELGWLSIYLVLGPIVCVINLICTYFYLGYSALTGFVFLLVFIQFQGFMGRLFSKYRRETTEITDQRVNLMTELLIAMKLVKLYCWEFPFSQKVREIRHQEITQLRNTYILEGINSALFYVATKFMLFACFVTFVLTTDGLLTAPIVFFTMAMYNAVRVPATRFFPSAVALTNEIFVALDRVTNVLLLDERSDDDEFYLTSTSPHQSIPIGSVEMMNFSAKWTKKQKSNALEDLSFKIEPGELVIVIGSVGSGKSCLLHALLNEIEATNGQIKLGGDVSYAPQEPWCFGASLRENILLGNQFNANKYQRVIDACALEGDLKLFEKSDETFIGEKGNNLSGGQQARVNLARAIYFDADTYLLDDPLSAVDPKIANHIFERCIRGYLHDKTVILVTHQLQFLQRADKIIMIKEGRLVAHGSYDQLISTSVPFLKLLDRRRKERERKDSVSKQRSMSLKREISTAMSPEVIEPVQNDIHNLTSDKDDDRDEKKTTGSVSFNVIWKYFRSGGSKFIILTTLSISLSAQALYHYIDLWLAAWTQSTTIQSYHLTSQTQSHESFATGQVFSDAKSNIIFYSVLIFILFISIFIRMLSCFILCLKCSINLHSVTFESILRAPMAFFEVNPLGRILNRFTRDIGIVDNLIPRSIIELNICLLEVIGSVLITCVISRIMIIPTVILGALSIPVREYYVRTARDLNRVDAIFRSPTYHYLTSTFDGLITIRAFKIQKKCEEQYIRYLRDSTACRFLVFYGVRVLAIILEGFSNIYILCICIVLVETPRDAIGGGDAGLVLAQSLTLVGIYQYCVRMTSEFENQMISTERVLEYSNIQPEADLRIAGKVEDKDWPSKGEIILKDVNLRYNRNNEPVLKNITFKVNAGEKIGIVGRTGAGKSSLISMLFRLVEPEGTIIIDGVDIKTLGLHELRSRISIIPQDPSLFSGTVRLNLDPFSEYDDGQLWSSLEEAHLKEKIVKMGGLDALVTEGGSNLSVGQRQLLCMARALLKKNRILVMDEATASVDLETDELIGATIETTFKNYTILIVAHRLNTIIEMDKILVMDAGRVVEYDAPYKLLENTSGVFHSMVKQTGRQFEKQLHSLARKAYRDKGYLNDP